MPPRANGRVTVRINAVEDDSGTPFGDDDDTALAGGFAGTPIPIPAGEGKELVPSQVMNFTSTMTGGDDLLQFGAQIIFSVRYL
jgi:hypothetical protein